MGAVLKLLGAVIFYSGLLTRLNDQDGLQGLVRIDE